jgi:hypothetical protein
MHLAFYLRDAGALSPVGGLLTPPNRLAVFAPYLALLGIVVTVAVVVVMKPHSKAENNWHLLPGFQASVLLIRSG